LSADSSQDNSFHIESHAALLQHRGEDGTAHLGRSRPPDAIVVPTIRPWLLRSPIALAGDIGSALVVLCAAPEQGAQAMQECGTLLCDVLMTYVSPSAEANLLALLPSEHPEKDIEPSCHVGIPARAIDCCSHLPVLADLAGAAKYLDLPALDRS
jgi:hypothetical protein